VAPPLSLQKPAISFSFYCYLGGMIAIIMFTWQSRLWKFLFSFFYFKSLYLNRTEEKISIAQRMLHLPVPRSVIGKRWLVKGSLYKFICVRKRKRKKMIVVFHCMRIYSNSWDSRTHPLIVALTKRIKNRLETEYRRLWYRNQWFFWGENLLKSDTIFGGENI
jgi:hypothetical protein